MVHRLRYVKTAFVLLVLILVPWSSHSFGATSCVTCHTNESIMKSLYRPPAIPAVEGEG